MVVERSSTGEDILFRILAVVNDCLFVRDRWGASGESRFARFVVKALAIDIFATVCGVQFESIKLNAAATFEGLT